MLRAPAIDLGPNLVLGSSGNLPSLTEFQSTPGIGRRSPFGGAACKDISFGRPIVVMQKVARSLEHRCISLLDLPESLLISIFRCMPTETKCRAELVCKTFRDVLSNPAPGTFVWDVISLDDAVFSKAPLSQLNRQAVYLSYHTCLCGSDGVSSSSDRLVGDAPASGIGLDSDVFWNYS